MPINTGNASIASLPATLTVVGTVSSIEPAYRSVILDVVQALNGSSSLFHLEIYTRMEDSPHGTSQLTRLPLPNTIVTFSGTLVGVHDGAALLNIETIVRIPRPRSLPLAVLPLNYRRYMSIRGDV